MKNAIFAALIGFAGSAQAAPPIFTTIFNCTNGTDREEFVVGPGSDVSISWNGVQAFNHKPVAWTAPTRSYGKVMGNQVTTITLETKMLRSKSGKITIRTMYPREATVATFTCSAVGVQG